MNELSIGEVARRSGLRPSAIRYYEHLGLLASPARVNGRRRYTSLILRELTYIQFARRVGFTLCEIKSLKQQQGSLTSKSTSLHDAMDEKLAQLHAQIGRMQLMTEILERGRDCHCQTPEECVILDRTWWSEKNLPSS